MTAAFWDRIKTRFSPIHVWLCRMAVWLRRIYTVLSLLKVPVIMSLIAIVALTVPGQVLEIYRILLADVGNFWVQVVMGILGLGFMTFMFWYSGRWLTLNLAEDKIALEDADSWMVRWFPRLFAVAPALALGGVFLWGPDEILSGPAENNVSWLRWTGGLILVLSALFVIWTWKRTRLFGGDGSYQPNAGVFGLWALIGARCLPLFLCVAVLVAPVRFPEIAGSIFFGLTFFALLTLLLAWSSIVSARHRVPLTLAVFGVAVLFSWLDINDNHEVRNQPLPVGTQEPLSVEEAFRTWLMARPDREYYRRRGAGKYPVYIVAAEGGGIYAAQHAAAFLARMQDICPAFAGHTFAISGISGGSVGAGVFASLLAEPKLGKRAATGLRGQKCGVTGGEAAALERHVDAVLSRDLLSPLVAATVTNDFVQRFSPFVFGPADRARALEDALSDAWDRAGLTKGSLNRTVRATWTADGHVPALILNTTSVNTGERVATSPIKLEESAGRIRTMTRYMPEGRGLSIATAAVLSARFTYITPAGTAYEKGDRSKEKVRFVDGGYFENSGVDTAMDIITAIRPIADREHVEIRLISLQYKHQSGPANHGIGEAMSPIRALLATRTHRGQMATERAKAQLAGACPASAPRTSLCDGELDINDPFRLSVVHDEDGSLPLGWLLSEQSRQNIGKQIGHPGNCNYINGHAVLKGGRTEMGAGAVYEHDNACILKFIQVELTDGIPGSVGAR